MVVCCVTHGSGQMIIFHQPTFPWNKGISLFQLHFAVRSCEVAIIWPDGWLWNIVEHIIYHQCLNCNLPPLESETKCALKADSARFSMRFISAFCCFLDWNFQVNFGSFKPNTSIEAEATMNPTLFLEKQRSTYRLSAKCMHNRVFLNVLWVLVQKFNFERTHHTTACCFSSLGVSWRKQKLFCITWRYLK